MAYTPKNIFTDESTPQGVGGSSYVPKNIFDETTVISTEQPKKKTAAGQFLSGFGSQIGRGNVANIKESATVLDRVLYNSLSKFGSKAIPDRETALKYYQDKQKKIDEYKQKTEDKLKQKLGDDYNSLATQMGGGLAQGVSQIGTMFIPVVGPGVAMSLNSAQIAAASKNDYRDAYEQTLKDTGDKALATKNAKIVGTVSGIVNMAEMVIPGKLMFAEKLMGKGSVNMLKQFAKTAATESLTEGLQDATVSTAKMLTYDKEQNPIKEGLYSMLVSLPTSVLFGGVDVVGNVANQKKMQEVAVKMTTDQIIKGVTPEQAVNNTVNILGTLSEYGKDDIYSTIGNDILEQSQNAAELYDIELQRQAEDPMYVPSKETTEIIKGILRSKQIYDMYNSQEVGIIKKEDGSITRIDVVPYADDKFVAKITEILPDGTETVRQETEVFETEQQALENAQMNLTPEEIEVGEGPMFRMSDVNNDIVKKDIIENFPKSPLSKERLFYNNGEPVVAMELNVRDDEILLDNIRSFETGKGNAKKALSKLKSIADKNGYKITGIIQPTGEKKLNTKQLSEFYSKNGFIVNGKKITYTPLDKTTEQVDTNNNQYDKRTISKGTDNVVREISDQRRRATQYLGRLFRMVKEEGYAETDNGGKDNNTQLNSLISSKVKEYQTGKSVDINNVSIASLVEFGMKEETADTLSELSTLKNNPIKKIQLLKFDSEFDGFVAYFDGKDTLVINSKYINSLTPKQMTHEFSHAWYKSIENTKKQEFINNLRNDIQTVYDAWDMTKSPYNDYAEQQFDMFVDALVSKGYTESVAKKLVSESGIKKSYDTVKEFVDDSFNIMAHVNKLNEKLILDNKRLKFNEYNSVSINEHIAVIAEFSQDLESDNEVINNFIEMSDNGTYEFGTALSDKTPLYLRQQDVSLSELQDEYNKSFAVDEVNLSDRIEMSKENIKNFNEMINEHPGKEIAKYVSRKEGEFVDRQFEVIPYPKNKTEELKNERARFLTKKVEDLINEYGTNGEYKGDYIIQDVARTMYDEYISLVKQRETFKKDLVQMNKDFKVQTAEVKSRVQKLADSALRALKESLIPARDRKVWMEKIATIGTDNIAYKQFLEDVAAESYRLRIDKDIDVEKAKLREQISVLRRVNDVAPALVKDVKKSLGFDKPVNKLSLKELMAMKDELNNRIDFLESHGYSLAGYTMSKPTYEQYLEMGKDVTKMNTGKERVKRGFSEVVNTITEPLGKLFLSMSERIDAIAPVLGQGLRTLDFNIQERLNKEFLPVVKAYADVYDKLTPDEQNALTAILGNSEYDKAYQLFESKGLDTKPLKDLKKLFRIIYDELAASGVDIKELKDFFPRFLTRAGMKEVLNTTSFINAEVQNFEAKNGRTPNEAEMTKITTNFLRGLNIGGRITVGDGRFGESRTLDVLNRPEFVNLYENTVNSALFYFSSAVELIETKKFFNKMSPGFFQEIKDKDLDLSMAIPYFAEKLVREGKVSSKDLNDLQEMLQIIFNKDSYSRIEDILTQSTYILGLGQPTSIITQLSEMIIYLGNESLPKNLKISPEDANVRQAFDIDTSNIQELTRNILIFMSKGDMFSATVGINAIAHSLVKAANADVNSIAYKQLYEQLGYVFLGNQDKVLQKIKDYDFKGEPPLEMIRMIYGAMSKYRPLGRMDKSYYYAKYPWAGVFRNFGVKVLTRIMYENPKKMAAARRKGDMKLFAHYAKAQASYIAMLVLAGVSSNIIKDLIRGKFDEKKEEDLWVLNYIYDSFAKLFFLSRYSLENINKMGGIGSVIVDALAPAPAAIHVDLADSIWNDVRKGNVFDLEETKTLTRIPGVGDVVKTIFQRD